MPKLPGVEDLGPRPSFRPSGGYAGGGGRGYDVPPPGGSRAVAAAVEDVGSALYQGGATAFAIDKERKDQEAKYQEAAATASFLKQKVLLDNAFDNDPDYTTYGSRYADGMKKSRAAAAALIADPERRKFFDLKADTLEAEGAARIADKARAKEKDVGRGYMTDQLASLQDTAARASDEQTRTAALEAMNGVLLGARNRGHISYEEEAKLRQSSTEAFAERSLNALPFDQKLKALLGQGTAKAGTASPAGGDAFAEAADRHGVSADYLQRTAQIESGGNPEAKNASGARGLFQFMPDTARQYGLANPNDAGASIDAAARLGRDNSDALAKALGRSPSDAQLYLAHQQGAAGAVALMRGGDKPAVEALMPLYGSRAKAAAAITGNGGTADMTAGEFVARQNARYAQSPPAEVKVAQVASVAPAGGSIVDFLRPDKRQQMLDTTLRTLSVLEERDQRRAEKALKDAGDQAEKDLDAMAVDGTLTRDAIERRKSLLSPTAYKSALKALDPKQADVKDDRDAVLRLEPILDSPEAPALIDQSYQVGELSTTTYRSMREKVRTFQKDDQPDSPYRSGRKFLTTALDPGQIGPDPMMRQPLAIAQARALADFDAWSEANPKITRVQAMTKADELMRAWQTVGFSDMRLALPRPRGFTGNKADVTGADVAAARAAVVGALDRGEISNDQAKLELDPLDVWDRVLAKPVKK